ncbi:2OG-Fe(II) oxygenase [uncultured Erythrobacter sp.]|uniref:2OG-Fe(II) oxygenase n=1 Tax=uncultured Erythrobacter sp. TaxID=263913 RepID=UPI0026124A7B|nr:2OG-Fe(II) oxygenase [uncultured Erythrobacter sp.]
MNPDLSRAVELAQAGDGEAARAIVAGLADDHDPDALYTLGDMYWRGVLVDCNWRRALGYFAAAEKVGNLGASYAITNLMASGLACQRDWGGSIERLAREAEANEQRASAMRLIEAMKLDVTGDPVVPPTGEQISHSPDIRSFARLFSAAECQHLVSLAEPFLAPSVVTGPNLEQIPDPIRTSDSATIHHLIEDPAVHALNRRLATVTDSEWACGEPLVVLRYRPGQHYLNHLDALPGLANQRVTTALVYLNQGYEGGHTAFPAAGISYRGEVGDAIVFRNVLDDGQPDQSSVHAGLPVIVAEKYLASRWIREASIYGEMGQLTD